MVDLPELPKRIARLPRDSRGFPIPYFVDYVDGQPDFRCADGRKFAKALTERRCWVCGDTLGRHRIFVIGPMCVINKVTSEPPCHRDCAEFSVRVCPFLTKPRMRRNAKDLPEESVDPAGFHIDRNPGVTCLYETESYKPFRPHQGGDGCLFRLGVATRVDWWSQGRQATRDEVLESITSGYPLLEKMAQLDGADSVKELHQSRDKAMALLPA